MTIVATWNVNSITIRRDHLLAWLEQAEPDIVLLQELKVEADGFPTAAVRERGYQASVVGQKAYNGVAVLSKQPIEVVASALPGDAEDHQARFLDVRTGGLRVASLYCPNGNPVDSDKFVYKLFWLARLREYTEQLLAGEEPAVLGGDYNVAPTDEDVHDPRRFANDALCHPESRKALRRILWLGLTDAIATCQPGPGRFTWWDYRARGFDLDHGVRIDHLLLTPRAADRLTDAAVDRTPRGWDKPSDHAPVTCTLAAPA